MRSVIGLPGAVPADETLSPDVVIDVEFCHLNVGNKPRDGTRNGATVLGPYRLASEGLEFTMPGVGRYLCRPGSRAMTIAREPGASDDDLAAYLQATALPALLWMRGATMLHSSAAVLPGASAAVAIAGPSGVGKSTLLRRLIEAGASVVSDDSLAVRPETSALPLVSGLPACTQLCQGDGTRISRPVSWGQQLVSARLAAVVELGAHGDPEPRRVAGAEALTVLLRNLHRPRVPRILGIDRTVLPGLAGLAGQLRVYTWNAETALRYSVRELVERLQGL